MATHENKYVDGVYDGDEFFSPIGKAGLDGRGSTRPYDTRVEVESKMKDT